MFLNTCLFCLASIVVFGKVLYEKPFQIPIFREDSDYRLEIFISSLQFLYLQ